MQRSVTLLGIAALCLFVATLSCTENKTVDLTTYDLGISIRPDTTGEQNWNLIWTATLKNYNDRAITDVVVHLLIESNVGSWSNDINVGEMPPRWMVNLSWESGWSTGEAPDYKNAHFHTTIDWK
jgi:hypothetical protein